MTPVAPPPYPAPAKATSATDGVDPGTTALSAAALVATLAYAMTQIFDGDTIAFGPGTFVSPVIYVAFRRRASGGPCEAGPRCSSAPWREASGIRDDRTVRMEHLTVAAEPMAPSGPGDTFRYGLTITWESKRPSKRRRSSDLGRPDRLVAASASTVSGNTSRVYGGIDSAGDVTVVDSTIADNHSRYRRGWVGPAP